MKTAQERIIVALDVDNLEKVKSLIVSGEVIRSTEGGEKK